MRPVFRVSYVSNGWSCTVEKGFMGLALLLWLDYLEMVSMA